MNPSETGWQLCDEWFADFIQRLERSSSRVGRMWQERPRIPDAEEAARAFTEKTEQLRRYLAAERERLQEMTA